MASDSPGGVPLLSAQFGDEAALSGCILIANYLAVGSAFPQSGFEGCQAWSQSQGVLLPKLRFFSSDRSRNRSGGEGHTERVRDIAEHFLLLGTLGNHALVHGLLLEKDLSEFLGLF